MAETATVERLLNTYLRELVVAPAEFVADERLLAQLPNHISEQLLHQGLPMRLVLPKSSIIIWGSIIYFSPIGLHKFGDSFWRSANESNASSITISRLELATLLLSEISNNEPGLLTPAEHINVLRQHIENSIEKTALYVDQRLNYNQPWLDLEDEDRFLAAEQALLFGHPFHPMPKSSDGFLPEDLDRYAPELGASFALHYFVLSPQLVREEFLPGSINHVIPRRVIEQTKDCLNSAQRDWQLLPCHPWQATFLYRQSNVQALIDADELSYLGPLGETVYPTSSVRTIVSTEHPFFFKLPLSVRITNYIRINPLEHLQRSIDVSRAISTVKAYAATPNLTVLLEVGFRTIAPRHWSEADQQQLMAQFGVLFRERPPITGAAAPMVVAAILEPCPHTNEPLIIRVIKRANGNVAINSTTINSWLRRYVEISLIPLLRLFIHTGISLEAHVQNSLIVLHDGWPKHLYVRDLEGGSISRDRAVGSRLCGKQIDEQSPALYDDDQAWHRLKYYLLVNHFGHLISTLAHYGRVDEYQLWQVVRDTVSAKVVQEINGVGRRYLEELLDGPELPAKANLLSSFHQCSERPLYINIPNFLRGTEAL
ncbi:MAG: IucA/IucC family protein [Acidobacteriota bacterium]